MKKLLMAGMMLAGSSALYADYELFVTYTKPLSSIKGAKKSTVLFSGDYKDYQEEYAKMNKYAVSTKGEITASTAMIGGLSGLGTSASMAVAGLGVGLAAGLLTPVILDAQDDERFIRVIKIENSKGNFTLKRILMVGNKHPHYSIEQANEIMKGAK